MTGSALWDVRIVSVGRSLIAGPEAFWMSRWGERLPLAFNVAVARRGDYLVLVNTSPPDSTQQIEAEFPAMRYLHDAPVGDLVRGQGQMMRAALARIGVSPEQVTHVILTPLELYTTSTLRLFRNATIGISERGWVHFHTTHDHPHDSRWRSFDRATLVDLVTDAWDRVRLLEDEDELAPGLRTWWAGAHHRETIVVEFDTSVGVVAVSDAYFYAENVETMTPIGLCENIYEALDCYRRIRATAAHVIGIHDPGVFDRYPDGVIAGSVTAEAAAAGEER